MNQILSATAPIYLAVALGYVTTRMGMFDREVNRAFARFIVKIALPCLIFANLSTAELGDVLNPTYLGSYILAMATMMSLGLLWSRARGQRSVRGVFMGMGMGAGNDGFVGFPLFLFVIPSLAAVGVGMDMIADNAFFIPAVIGLAEIFHARENHAGDGAGWQVALTQVRLALVRVITNPMVVALILALIVSGLGWELPQVLDRSVALFAQASSGLALFSVGGLLVGVTLRAAAADLAVMTLGKLILMPVLTLGIMSALVALGLPELEPGLKAALILSAALPAMSMLSSLSVSYGEEELGAAGVLTTTIASAVTLTAWVAIVHSWGWI